MAHPPALPGEPSSGRSAAKPPKPPIPWWGWVMAGVCILIPVVALGGMIPAAIGGGGAFGCIAVAREPRKSVGARIAICAAIAAVCWIAFIALVVGIGIMQARSGAP